MNGTAYKPFSIVIYCPFCKLI